MGRNILVSVLLVANLVALSARAGNQQAAANQLSFVAGQEPDHQALTLDDVVNEEFSLHFKGFDAGKLKVVNTDADTEAVITSSCTLDVTGGSAQLHSLKTKAECDDVFAPLLLGKPTKLLLVKPDASAYAVVEYVEPEAYAAPATTINVTRSGNAPNDTFTWPSKVPSNVALASGSCWVFIEKARPLTCDNATGIQSTDADTKAALQASWRKGDTRTLYMKVKDAKSPKGDWRKFSFTGESEPKPPTPVTTPDGTLLGRCRYAAALDPKATNPFYAVCVDAFAGQESIVSLACASSGTQEPKLECSPVGDVVLVRRDFYVFVWHEVGTRSVVKLGGTAGNDSLLYEAKKAPEAMNLAPRLQPSLTIFGPRKFGTAELEIRIKKEKEDGTTADLRTVNRTFIVERFYRMAIRLGLGFTWAPDARTVGIRSTLDGQRYVSILHGKDNGLYSTEVVAGISFFLCDMPENDPKICGALGARLGVISVQGGSTKAVSSFMVGPELAIGKDFSIGLFAGVIRHDPPDNDYEPGRLVPSTVQSVPTQPGVTEGLSLVLNFTPGFLSGVGLAP